MPLLFAARAATTQDDDKDEEEDEEEEEEDVGEEAGDGEAVGGCCDVATLLRSFGFWAN